MPTAERTLEIGELDNGDTSARIAPDTDRPRGTDYLIDFLDPR